MNNKKVNEYVINFLANRCKFANKISVEDVSDIKVAYSDDFQVPIFLMIMRAFEIYMVFGCMSHTGWSIKGRGMCYPVCVTVHLRYPLLLIRKSSVCGYSRFPLKKYVTMTICLMSNSR